MPEEVRKTCLSSAGKRGRAYTKWKKLFKEYAVKYPELADMYKKYFSLYVPDLSDMEEALKTDKAEATRVSGGKVICELAKRIPNLLSGSADLTPSTKTNIVGEGWFSPENRAGRNIHFGIREHAMAAICNGVAAHGGLRIICSTFFVFSDYMKGAMRLSAIMKLPVMYVLTHDSIGVGEDGATHQPIEQLAMLRATPDINVYRPCDRRETIAAFKEALKGSLPSVLVMSRQALPQYSGKAERGGYVISGCKEKPDFVLISSGSEVSICMQAQRRLLKDKNISASVVSVYCTELFDSQSEAYKNSVIPKLAEKVCIEASSDNIWYKYAEGGRVINMTSFGLSGKMEELYPYFGFSAENIVLTVTGKQSIIQTKKN